MFFVFVFYVWVVVILSVVMSEMFKVIIVLFDDYVCDNYGECYFVVYLLYGLGGDYIDWMLNMYIVVLVDCYCVIFVMFDGGYESWYIDSLFDLGSCYEIFIGDEVVFYVDLYFCMIVI